MVKRKFPANQTRKKSYAGCGMTPLMLSVMILAIVGCAGDILTRGGPPEFVGKPERMGELAHPQLAEVSGLAASSLYPSLLWAINDGGDDPLLYAIGSDGADLGTFRVEGAKNIDWEALSSFRLQDSAYLLIADVGDNWKKRQNVTLYAVREPTITLIGLDNNTTASVAWQIHFTYADGPQDCEAVAVDPVNQRILLLAKHAVSPQLYVLPLQPADRGAPAVAQPLTTIPQLSWPTGMDLSPDGRAAVVLTYNHAYLFRRTSRGGWQEAFQRKPQQLSFERLKQQEAICFGFYGKSVWLTSERRPAPLVRIDLEE
jgi:hypothetical protein